MDIIIKETFGQEFKYNFDYFFSAFNICLDLLDFKWIGLGEKQSEHVHKYMHSLTNDNLVTEIIQSQNLKISVDFFRKRCMHIIFQECFRRDIDVTKIIGILIHEYNFIPDDDFIEYHLCAKFRGINIKVFVFLHDHINMKKYITAISTMLVNQIQKFNINDLKILINLGYDIAELYHITDHKHFNNNLLCQALHNRDENVLDFLIELSIDFKPYESELITNCICNLRMKHLKVLLKHGADLQVIQTMKTTLHKKQLEMYKLLTENNINAEIVLELMMETLK